MDAARNEQTIRVMFEDSPIGMCAITIDGNLLHSNAACKAIIGASGTSIYELVAYGERRALMAALHTVHGGLQPAFRLAVEAAGGRRLEISGIPARGGPGDVMLYLVDVSERYQREERLRELSERDPLTGLLNRLSFHEAVSKRIALKPIGTLMMVDLDNFKRVNDTYGHQTGDAVLAAVAQAIRRAVAADDLVARLGGDEFAIFSGREGPAVANAANILIRRISIAAASAARNLPISASLGIVPLNTGVSPADLIAMADRAMYAAKRTGKGRFVTATTLASQPRALTVA